MINSHNSSIKECNDLIEFYKLAVEENEPKLASNIFNNINAFANDLRTRYTRLVKENKEIMLKIEYTGQTALQKIQLSLLALKVAISKINTTK